MASPRSLITDSASILKDVMLVELAPLADAMIAKIIGRARGLTRSQRLRAIKEIPWTGENAYRKKIQEALAEIALDAYDEARKEMGLGRKFALSEELDSIQLAAKEIPVLMDRLPAKIQRELRKQADLLVGTQLQDLQKNIFFQWTSSYNTTEDLDVLEEDLKTAAIAYIEGNAVAAGSNLLASKTVNESRNSFFLESDVLEEIDAFEFINGDPVTEVCQDLAGTVFAKDDPDMFRYTPPLHWNCKSWIRPILKGNLPKALERSGQAELEKLKPSTKKIEESIQFSEKYLTNNGACSHH